MAVIKIVAPPPQAGLTGPGDRIHKKAKTLLEGALNNLPLEGEYPVSQDQKPETRSKIPESDP